jgi:uncharacterized phiE125 gp8 family phage protein
MAKRVLITAATERALSVTNFKTHARIDETAEDTYIGTLLDAAEDEAETFCWRKFITQTWDQYFDGFSDPLVLAFAPVSSITSISYLDENGTTQTLATSVYELAEVDGLAVVRLKYNQSWPTTRAHEDVVTVRFICGYGAATAVPQRIIQAIAVHAAWAYRNREGDVEKLPETFHRLLRPFRLQRFASIGGVD